MNTVTHTQSKAQETSKIRVLTMIAMLSAISYILAFIELPMPLAPSFAKLDISDLPAMIAAFAFGPIPGVFVELIKNALQLMTTSTGGIGEFANFLMGGSFVFTAGMIYRHNKSRKTAIFACGIASIVMGIAAALANYFILLPMFEVFMPMEQVIASFAEVMPFINTKLDVVIYSALPGNVLKGVIISIVTMLLYKRLTPILKGRG